MFCRLPKLYLCEFCLKYMKSSSILMRHMVIYCFSNTFLVWNYSFRIHLSLIDFNRSANSILPAIADQGWLLSPQSFISYYNVKLQKFLSYTFFGGNVVRVLVHFFFTTAHFHLALVAASISHVVTAATKFSCCSSSPKMSPFFFSLALDLCHPFYRWASLAYRLLSLFLCLSLALYSKFMGMTINLSLIL